MTCDGGRVMLVSNSDSVKPEKPMFTFLHRSAPRYPTIRQRLVDAGLLSAADPDALTLLERHGSHSGRRVNLFRAFNPTDATRGRHSRSSFRGP
jgi:hypothetical protein